jgi:hypothetical protein
MKMNSSVHTALAIVLLGISVVAMADVCLIGNYIKLTIKENSWMFQINLMTIGSHQCAWPEHDPCITFPADLFIGTVHHIHITSNNCVNVVWY